MTKHVAVMDQEQIDANELEASVVADTATQELLDRYRELNSMVKKASAEMETIKSLIRAEMIKQDLSHFTDEFGTNLTTLSTTKSSSLDREGLEAKLGVEVVGEFVRTKMGTKLNIW